MTINLQLENILIRTCQMSDFEPVYELLKQLWPDRKFDKKELGLTFLTGLEDKNNHFIVSVVNENIIGFCSVSIRNSLYSEGNLAHLDELVIDESYRNNGIGQLFLNKVKAISLERNCKKLELDSALYRKEAHLFYEKYGFEKSAFVFTLSLE